ncbi:hypothetical protein [[Mycobacterium] burgundiense]|uniref:hypothetical protein n=1 Tax=[Mycobacterium] burgundiense TaxID=3064286 RepID=UPI002803FC71|nr:hypothetical protein [Mycolicibacterium sp. MU0053]
MAHLDQVGFAGQHRFEPLTGQVGRHLAAVGPEVGGEATVEVGGQHVILLGS